MITLGDKQLYYTVVKRFYTFAGPIVDLGAFLGAAAISMLLAHWTIVDFL
jgi:hypothetical protein